MDLRSEQALALAMVAVLVAASGCSALGIGGGSGTSILLVNDDNEAQDTVTVEIVDDGGEGEQELFSAEASPGAEANVDLGSFSETGEYTVLVTVDGRTTRLSYEFTDGDDAVSIGIDNDGNVFMGA